MSMEEILRLMLPITRRAESGNRDFRAPGVPVRSPAGALYAMQTMPATARQPGFGVQPARAQTPQEYNRVGEQYLGAMLRKYNDPGKAWAAYNWGPGAMDRHLARHGDQWLGRLPGDVRRYVSSNQQALGRIGPRPPAAPPSPALAAQTTPQPPQGTMPTSPLNAAQPPQPGTSPLDTLRSIDEDYKKLAERRALLRKQNLDLATQRLQAQRKGLSSEELFALSAAFFQPTRYKGFGGMMSNVMPVLSEIGQLREQRRAKNADELARLSSEYLAGGIEDEEKTLGNRLEVGKAIATQERPRRQWSETLQRFVDPTQVEVVGTGVKDGRRVLKYSDGTMAYENEDGTLRRYDAAGNPMQGN